MNWNFMMAGTASTNPVMFAISAALMLAWKNAGWIGLDRFLLPLLGTPWQPGRVFRHEGHDATRGKAVGDDAVKALSPTAAERK